MTLFTNILHTLRDFYAARHEPENMRPLAEWYWRVLLTVAMFALIFVVMYGVWEFWAVMQNLTAGATRKHSETRPLLDKRELAATLDGIVERQAAFDEMRRGRSNIADPSR